MFVKEEIVVVTLVSYAFQPLLVVTVPNSIALCAKPLCFFYSAYFLPQHLIFPVAVSSLCLPIFYLLLVPYAYIGIVF